MKKYLLFLILIFVAYVLEAQGFPNETDSASVSGLTGDVRLGTGYDGFISRKMSSAAIEGVAYDDIKNSTQTQIMNALYGMIPGLAVYQNGSGARPDDIYPSINVRGRGSYSGNQVLVL